MDIGLKKAKTMSFLGIHKKNLNISDILLQLIVQVKGSVLNPKTI